MCLFVCAQVAFESDNPLSSSARMALGDVRIPVAFAPGCSWCGSLEHSLEGCAEHQAFYEQAKLFERVASESRILDVAPADAFVQVRVGG